jgi:hypothetical protein
MLEECTRDVDVISIALAALLSRCIHRSGVSVSTNLLIALHRYASSQDENFATESFVHLLRHLLSHDPVVGLRLISRLIDAESESSEAINLNATSPDLIRVNTQVTLDEGRPDIEIAWPDYLVYVEVKVDSMLGHDQVERYLRALHLSSVPHALLVLLSRYPLGLENSAGVRETRWYHLGHWLSDESDGPTLAETSRYLIRQFCAFLTYRGLMTAVPRTPISAGVRAYLAGGDQGNLLLGGRIRSLRLLDGHDDLRPLQEVLALLRMAIKRVRPKSSVKLGAGSKGWNGSAWLSYNINNLDFFAGIYLNEPDRVVFDTYGWPIDPTRHNGQMGELYESNGKTHWANTLDLASPAVGFFEMTDDEKVGTVIAFLQDSFAYAESLRSAD